MSETLWSVQFSSNNQGFGGGVVILNNNRVVGGDAGYYYMGQCTISGSNASAIIEVKKHGSGQSIFGPYNEFTLNLTGTVAGNTITFNGNMAQNPQMKMTATMKKLVNL